MSILLLAPTYARHAPRATFRLREQESAVRVTLERNEAPAKSCAPSANRMSIQLRGRMSAHHAIRALIRNRERAVARSVL